MQKKSDGVQKSKSTKVLRETGISVLPHDVARSVAAPAALNLETLTQWAKFDGCRIDCLLRYLNGI